MAADTLWDFPTRTVHWSLAIALVLNLFVLEQGETIHQWVGYTASGLVLFRVLWGFISGRHSRFSSFPIRPREIVQFGKGFFIKNPPRYPGHNPAASLTYILIWGSVLSLGFSGWLMGTDAYWGEAWLEDLHGNISVVIQALILVHFAGMAVDSFRYKRKTWLSMLTGKRV